MLGNGRRFMCRRNLAMVAVTICQEFSLSVLGNWQCLNFEVKSVAERKKYVNDELGLDCMASVIARSVEG